MCLRGGSRYVFGVGLGRPTIFLFFGGSGKNTRCTYVPRLIQLEQGGGGGRRRREVCEGDGGGTWICEMDL